MRRNIISSFLLLHASLISFHQMKIAKNHTYSQYVFYGVNLSVFQWILKNRQKDVAVN